MDLWRSLKGKELEGGGVPFENATCRSFFFGPSELSALRRYLPLHLRTAASTFNIVAACTWRCRTIALQPNLQEQVQLFCAVNACAWFNPPLPAGYYGNAIAKPPAVTMVGRLTGKPLSYAVELVRAAKKQVTEEYMQSVADLMVLKGRPHYSTVDTFSVSDVTQSGFREVDYGWGEALYAGASGPFPEFWVFHLPFCNRKGEDGILIHAASPAPP